MTEERIWAIIIALWFSLMMFGGFLYEKKYGKKRIVSSKARGFIYLLLGFQWLYVILFIVFGADNFLRDSKYLEFLYDLLLPVLLGIPLSFAILEGINFRRTT